eukprot:CAMPEP_0113430504 /NCGR_PEP_ID=MMETSP0013_2-20120614/33046_1 /TAXON_ID=2843 ORGANISM="Skeletonema costatum, Strain 1716" /NCGR_SAMPLE_ID=MMETSP0013_2 /ASSEMBLY_ACC=CAM_ASM_000158 /LENGTH=42 /DNA_ID=CAMNT_0000319353 /DNA_START=53 /DNA_END=177 /DNA_ORIENTATION=+ /assembly_acc=CAM_ASM_000158
MAIFRAEDVSLQDERLAVLIGEDAQHFAKQMTRFYCDWKGYL